MLGIRHNAKLCQGSPHSTIPICPTNQRASRYLVYKSLLGLLVAGLDVAAAAIHCKPLWDWIKLEIVGVKRGWVLFLVLASLLTWGACKISWWVANREIVGLKAELSATNSAFLTYRAKYDLTPEEEYKWNVVVGRAYERGKYYRDINTNWLESAKAFEEAYTNAFSVAVKHPTKCSWTGHLAGNLKDMYQKLNRHGDAEVAGAAEIELQRLFNDDFTLNASSPCMTPAIKLRDRINVQNAPTQR